MKNIKFINSHKWRKILNTFIFHVTLGCIFNEKEEDIIYVIIN